MKKSIIIAWVLFCVLTLTSCQKAITGSEVYSFPEPTTSITVSFCSQGQEAIFVIDSRENNENTSSVVSVIEWFYSLQMTVCDKPEAVEGAKSYIFYVKESDAFTYEDRGTKAYILIGDSCYKVKNPTAPPIVLN